MITTTVSRIRQALVSSLFAFAVYHPVLAQESPAAVSEPSKKNDPDAVKMSPFLVTDKTAGYGAQQTLAGSRTAKDLLEIPGTVIILNREVIDDLGATTVMQAANFAVSGIAQANSYFDGVNIRGFGSAYNLRDGMTKPTFKTSPMYDVERVEVIKGPSAMLLGNNSFLGGSVNVISRKATATPMGDVDVRVSEKNSIRIAANLTGPLVRSDDFKLDYRLTAGYHTADRDKEIQNEDEKFIGGAFNMYFNANTSLIVNWYVFQNDGYRYWDDFINISTGLVYPGAPGGKGALRWGVINQYSTRSFSPGRHRDVHWENNDSFMNATFLTKLTENGNLRANLAISSLHDNRRLMRGITVEADNFTLDRQFFPRFIYDQVDYNVQLDYIHEKKFDWVKLSTNLGADGIYTYYRQAYTLLTAPALDTRQNSYPNDDAFLAANASIINSKVNASADGVQRPSQFSYYGQENVSFWNDRVILVGGLRWIVPGGYNTNMLLTTNANTERPDKTLKVHKYGVVVKVLPTVSVYYTDVLNLRQQIGFVDLNHGGDQLVPLKDSEGILKEYGVKFNHAFSDNLNAYGSLVHYDMSQTNIRIGTFTFPDGSIGQSQSAQDKAHGWEVDFGMRAKLGAGHTDLIITYSDGDSSTAADPTLQAAGFVPKKASFVAKYTWTDGALKGLMLGGAWMTQDPSRQASYLIDNKDMISLFGRYQINNHWSTQMNVENLTNQRYIVSIATTGLIEPSEPRRISADVKYRW
ncbi:MAG: TonB-dependent siderophore receptor [Verrucomicrobia bacterium]|nr:TonB-dependent siderophore receptor [Verrucomicrobiota bacterium]